jgi:hypothetical protein
MPAKLLEIPTFCWDRFPLESPSKCLVEQGNVEIDGAGSTRSAGGLSLNEAAANPCSQPVATSAA